MTTRPPRPEVFQAPVQQCARIVEMFEDFSQYHGVEEAGDRTAFDEVPVDQSGAGARLIRFLGQQLASEVEGIRVDLHTRNVETPACEQHLQYALAAPHIQHARSA